MNIYCVGNSVVSGDNLPSTLSTEIKKAFPGASVTLIDPSENFYPVEGSILIDSVENLDHVQVFVDISQFAITKSVSVHDYDLAFHLQLLQKLHKLPQIWIIGIPQFGNANDLMPQVVSAIQSCLKEE